MLNDLRLNLRIGVRPNRAVVMCHLRQYQSTKCVFKSCGSHLMANALVATFRARVDDMSATDWTPTDSSLSFWAPKLLFAYIQWENRNTMEEWNKIIVLDIVFELKRVGEKPLMTCAANNDSNDCTQDFTRIVLYQRRTERTDTEMQTGLYFIVQYEFTRF